MTATFLEQRTVLRLRLQAQRNILSGQIAFASGSPNDFPRSITMRLLMQRNDLAFLLATEVFPQLLRRFLARSSCKS